MGRTDVNREHGTHRGLLAWLGRPERVDRPATAGVAAQLAEFLGQATEENALRQAIDAGMRELGQTDAESTADAPR